MKIIHPIPAQRKEPQNVGSKRSEERQFYIFTSANNIVNSLS